MALIFHRVVQYVTRRDLIDYSWWGAVSQILFVIVCLDGLSGVYLPPPGVAVTILGFAAAIMAVRAVHNWTLTEKVLWITISFGLVVVELKSIYTDRENYDLHQRQSEAQETADFESIANGIHHQGIENANAFSKILGQANTLNQLDRKLATLRTEIYVARERHEEQKVASLELKAQEAQRQVSRVAEEVQALTMAPLIASQLLNWGDDRKGAMDDTYKRQDNEQLVYSHQKGYTQQGMDDIRTRWQGVRDKWDDDANAKLKELIGTAESVRKELRQWIPQITPRDKAEEQRFAQALKDGAIDRKDAAAYLEDLARRVPPPTPPSGPQ